MFFQKEGIFEIIIPFLYTLFSIIYYVVFVFHPFVEVHIWTLVIRYSIRFSLYQITIIKNHLFRQCFKEAHLFIFYFFHVPYNWEFWAQIFLLKSTKHQLWSRYWGLFISPIFINSDIGKWYFKLIPNKTNYKEIFGLIFFWNKFQNKIKSLNKFTLLTLLYCLVSILRKIKESQKFLSI
jgi:hypothetical protein